MIQLEYRKQEIRLTDRISWLPGGENPLSAEVVLIRGDQRLWLYDVGCGERTRRALGELPPDTGIVLSHFHYDHLSNLEHLPHGPVYAGAYTRKKVPEAILVDGPMDLEPGLTVLPFPSSHAKGCVALTLGDYIFLGDGIYACRKGYNVSVLAQTIRTLETLPGERCCVSHSRQFVRPKKVVLSMLRRIYASREPGAAFIPLPGETE